MSTERFDCDKEEVARLNTFAIEIYRHIRDVTNGSFVFSPPLILQNIFHLHRLSDNADSRKEWEAFPAKYQLTDKFEKLMKNFEAAVSGKDDHYEFHAATVASSALQKQGSRSLTFLDVESRETLQNFLNHLTNGNWPLLHEELNLNFEHPSLRGVAHFFSDWEYKFNRSLTNIFDGRNREEPVKTLPVTVEEFHNIDSTLSQVIAIHLQEKIFFTRSDDLKATILEFPLSRYEMSLALIVPDEKGKAGLERIEANLTHETLDKLRKDWQMPLTHVYLPRFSLQQNLALDKPMEKMGLKSLLKGDLHFNHLVNLEISVDCGPSLPPSKPRAGECSIMVPPTVPQGFHVDRPFLFFIKPRWPEMYLLMGRVTHLFHDVHAHRWNLHRAKNS